MRSGSNVRGKKLRILVFLMPLCQERAGHSAFAYGIDPEGVTCPQKYYCAGSADKEQKEFKCHVHYLLYG